MSIIHLFKHADNSADPTLRQQSLTGYKLGRYSAFAIGIVGVILSFLLSTWLSNLFQAFIWALFDPMSGVGHVFATKVFTVSALFHNQYQLANIPFRLFLLHGSIIASIIRFIAFGFIVYFPSKYAFQMWNRYKPMNHHEQGGDRFATVDEVDKMTNRIPDRKYRYDIPTGALMMHKMNLRGMINEIVKKELYDLILHFQLDKDHDPTGHEMNHFYATMKIMFTVVMTLLVMLSIHGFYNYNFGGNGGHVGASPFWGFLVIWWIIHFVTKGFLDIFVDLFKLQIDLFYGPWSLIILVLILESAVISIIAYHFLSNFTKAFRYGGMQTYFQNIKHKIHKAIAQFIHKKAQRKTANATNSDSLEFDKKDGKVDTLWQEIKNPLNYEASVKALLDKEHCHYQKDRNPKDTRYWRWEVIHSLIYPFYHGTHPFLKQPLSAMKLAWLQFLSNVLPLNEGTTGWYYLTHGSGVMQNILLYGITRSGKGQMVINTLIDVNSRAQPKYQKNMIFNDSKGELAASTSQILKKRGYNVKILNIMETSHSMSYNPLASVISQAQEGDVGAADKSCKVLASTIYNAKNAGSNKFFYDEAASLFDAITFALLSLAHSRYYGMDDYRTIKCQGHKLIVHDDGLASQKTPNYTYNHKQYYINKGDDGDLLVHSQENAWSRVTIHNTLALMTQLCGEPAQQKGSNAMGSSNRMVIYFEHLTQHADKLAQKPLKSETEEDQQNLLKQAISEFEQSKISGGGETAGSIYTTFINDLNIYQEPTIAEMTSMNSYHPAEMGFDRLLTVQFSRKFGQQAAKVSLYDGKRVNNGEYVPGKLVENVNSKLSAYGVSQVPFDKDVSTNHFFVKYNIFDERVNQNANTTNHFIFLIECVKENYTTEDYIRIYHNYRKRPSIADYEMVIGDNYNNYKQVKYLHNQLMYNTLPIKEVDKKHPGTYKPFKNNLYKLQSNNSKEMIHFLKSVKEVSHKYHIAVISKYTHQPVLRTIGMKERILPQDEQYEQAIGSPVQKLSEVAPEKVIRRKHFLYNDHPTALFLVTPPNQPQLNQLCTFLINQTFNTLSGLGLHLTKGRHIQRSVQYILDELGNIPAIPNLPTKLSIGLSSHQEFLLVFQNNEQMTGKYGKDDAHSIVSNCSTTYYILSKSENTIDAISKACGKRTVYSRGRNADPTKATGASYSGNLQSQPVITPTELRHFTNGQMLVLRTNDRTTVGGKNAVPWPLYDHGKYKMPYSFWFLKKYESSESLDDVPVVTPHKYLNLNDWTTQFTNIYRWMQLKNPDDIIYAKAISGKIGNLLENSGLPKKFVIILSNMLVAQVNQQGNTQGVLKVAHHIKQRIPFYKSLLLAHNLRQVSLYAYSVLANSKDQEQKLGLSIIRKSSKRKGFSLFNFLADEVDSSKDYIKQVHNTMDKLNKYQIHGIKANMPFIFGSPFEQIIGYMQYDIENQNVSHIKITSPAQYGLANEGWLMNQINYLFNLFLVDIGVLKVQDKHSYKLSPKAQQILASKEQYQLTLDSFFKKNSMSYTPNAPWQKIMSYGLSALAWINQHPQYNQYYGLAFAFNICSEDAYTSFSRYQATNGHVYDLGAVPTVYLGIILTLYTAILTNPNQAINTKSKSVQNGAKNVGKLAKHLDTMDAIIHTFYQKLHA